MAEREEEWPPELVEWVYGPPGELEDEPPSVGAVYAVQEEEDRIRWIPGYKELLLRYFEVRNAWHAQYRPGEPYPPEPEEHKQLVERISEFQRQRVVPPWEQPKEETLPW